ncbi:energy-coupling factor transporter transmembrane protein EcfT [Collinsella sp. AGMB00827]|uniref:Energy-coupling factor transporter transmembrane protein EcfT n=1 Tax=Collinsella ureilytica TaxID=2869515 RepID=A0ABS7MKE1_9ACTN|nr:energy-coupling factor transporter transmembrane component T [Collinsella urealyticum]MBY4797737.1 energy-coupling factor transporter transmembrane protein EcfT [Collinsella urealyticum]
MSEPPASSLHPAVLAAYLIFTLAFTMFALEPVLVALSFAGGLAAVCALHGFVDGIASLRWQLPLVLIAAVVNPFFSAAGSTEIVRLGVRAIYLESLACGATMGAMLCAVVLWFRVLDSLLPFDRVMTLFGNLLPVCTLMVAMVMRMIPRLVRQGASILNAERVVTRSWRKHTDPVRSRLRASGVLVGWALEDSLETADAMRARGWGAKARRTSYSRYRMSTFDLGLLAVVVISGCVLGMAVLNMAASFSFFPVLSPLKFERAMLAVAVWMLAPAILLLLNKWVWDI